MIGHHRLFLALARALVKDQAIYRLLFPPEEQPGGNRSPSERALAGADAAANALEQRPLSPAPARTLPTLDRIAVCDQDDSLALHRETD